MSIFFCRRRNICFITYSIYIQFSCTAQWGHAITTGCRHPITPGPPAGPTHEAPLPDPSRPVSQTGSNYSRGRGCVAPASLHCTARIAFLRAGAYQGRCMMRRTIWGRGRACIPHGMMGGVVLCLSLHTASAPVVVAAAALHAPANHFISSHRFAVPSPHHTARSRRRGCASLRGYDGCVLECGLARHGGVRDGTTLRLCPVSGVYFLFSS